jgi:chitin disaccharide deacetylase
MLIVTADDLGRSQAETDAILECGARGRLTTASAMVFMKDSVRAAARAASSVMPIGLHLNLSEPFTQEDVPGDLRERHKRICRFLKSSRYSLVLYHPLLASDFTRVVAAQFAEFRRLFGREPAYVDGHQHMHLSTNVLAQRLLPAGMRVRRSFSFSRGQKNPLIRMYRSWVDAALARRHIVSDYFVSLSEYLDTEAIERIVALSKRGVVELMAHPARPREYEFLMGDVFGRVPVCTRGELASYCEDAARKRA